MRPLKLVLLLLVVQMGASDQWTSTARASTERESKVVFVSMLFWMRQLRVCSGCDGRYGKR